MTGRPFLIDTDTASDDAVALVMALRHAEIEVVAITVVAGNVPLPLAVQNALYTVELCRMSTPVYAGASRPLMRPLETAEDVHGTDGMGDIGLDLRGREPAGDQAISVIIDAARRHAGRLTIVTLGPLTNLALAVSAAPDIVPLVERVVVMGGTGQGYGNVTPAAEFNIWVDPEAADIVFRSGLPLEMVVWDVSRQYATISAEESARLAALGPLGEFCTSIQAKVLQFCQEKTQLPGYDLPDPVTMAVALDPSIAVERRRLRVDVETAGRHTRGSTVVDHLGVLAERPNVEVVMAASHQRFLDLLTAAVAP